MAYLYHKCRADHKCRAYREYYQLIGNEFLERDMVAMDNDVKGDIKTRIVKELCWFSWVVCDFHKRGTVHVLGKDIVDDFEQVFYEVDSFLKSFPFMRIQIYVDDKTDNTIVELFLEGIPHNRVVLYFD